MSDTIDLLYAATGRWVIALDRFSGRPAWRRKLPRLFGGLITLHVVGDEVYAARGGYIYCLDRYSGDVLWERGVGAQGGVVMLCSSGGSADAAATAQHMAAQAASVAAVAASAGAVAAASG